MSYILPNLGSSVHLTWQFPPKTRQEIGCITNNSAAGCRVCWSFIDGCGRGEILKIHFGQSKMAESPKFQPLNRYNSADYCSISLIFGMCVRSESSEASADRPTIEIHQACNPRWGSTPDFEYLSRHITQSRIVRFRLPLVYRVWSRHGQYITNVHWRSMGQRSRSQRSVKYRQWTL